MSAARAVKRREALTTPTEVAATIGPLRPDASHARGLGFKSPPLALRTALRAASGRPRAPAARHSRVSGSSANAAPRDPTRSCSMARPARLTTRHGIRSHSLLRQATFPPTGVVPLRRECPGAGHRSSPISSAASFCGVSEVGGSREAAEALNAARTRAA